MDEPDDKTLPKTEMMHVRCSDLMLSVKSTVDEHLSDLPPEQVVAPKTVKRKMDATPVADLDIEGIARAGKLATLTNPILASFLKGVGGKATGVKAVLMDRINAHFGIIE